VARAAVHNRLRGREVWRCASISRYSDRPVQSYRRSGPRAQSSGLERPHRGRCARSSRPASARRGATPSLINVASLNVANDQRPQSKLIEVSTTDAHAVAISDSRSDRSRARARDLALGAVEVGRSRACGHGVVYAPLTPLRAATKVVPGKRTSRGSWVNLSSNGRPTRPTVAPCLLTSGSLHFHKEDLHE
jgi:hypothetical protein